jgi:hypothetical protein
VPDSARAPVPSTGDLDTHRHCPPPPSLLHRYQDFFAGGAAARECPDYLLGCPGSYSPMHQDLPLASDTRERALLQ